MMMLMMMIDEEARDEHLDHDHDHDLVVDYQARHEYVMQCNATLWYGMIDDQVGVEVDLHHK